MAFPHVLPAPVSAAFLSRAEETDVYLRKAGDSGQGPTVLSLLVRGLWAEPVVLLDPISL